MHPASFSSSIRNYVKAVNSVQEVASADGLAGKALAQSAYAGVAVLQDRLLDNLRLGLSWLGGS